MRASIRPRIALVFGAFLLVAPAHAAEIGFAFKTAYRNVSADPDRIWTDEAFSSGKVSIFEYELSTPSGKLLVSQIWNDDCASSTCPTRLARIDASGRATVLVDDLMHQVIPPNDPRFAGLSASGPQAAFAAHPFQLSADGKTLMNGDFKFAIDEAMQ